MKFTNPTDIAACADRQNGRFDLTNVEYVGVDGKVYLAASDGKMCAIVRTAGEEGRGLIPADQLKNAKGEKEVEFAEGRFPNIRAVLPGEVDNDRYVAVRLDIRRLDAIRKALNHNDTELTLFVPRSGDRDVAVSIIGQNGIGLLMPSVADTFGHDRKFNEARDQYCEDTRPTARV